jgi:PKD repeat protein
MVLTVTIGPIGDYTTGNLPSLNEEVYYWIESTTVPSGLDTNMDYFSTNNEMYFLENKGQKSEDAGLFYSKGSQVSVVLGDRWVSYICRQEYHSNGYMFRIRFIGANPMIPIGKELLPFDTHFYLGSDQMTWARNVNSFKEVLFPNIYDGIDLRFYFSNGELKYEFVVMPGSDPNQIRMTVEGVDRLEVHGDDTLRYGYRDWELLDTGLHTFYQDEILSEVQTTFKIISNNTFGFSLSSYNLERTIVIDPIIKSTYFGSREFDIAGSVALDINGNTIVAGYTISQSFPTTPGAFQEDSNGSQDIFVSKFDENCTTLIFSTLIGGSGSEVYPHMTLDGDGNIVLTGRTESDDFPVTDGSLQTVHNGDTEVFVLKLSSDGGRLLSSTYLGGVSTDFPNEIDVDNLGNVYITGVSDGGDFPTTPGSLFPESPFDRDSFVTKINGNLTSLVYSTYINGEDVGTQVYGEGIAVTDAGDVVVVGKTNSNQFPTTPGAFKTSKTGTDMDGYVAKLNHNGSALVFCTYLGGVANDVAWDVSITSEGLVVIAGETEGGLPTTQDAFQRSYGGNKDGFVSILSSDGARQLHSSYLGGREEDFSTSVALDQFDNIYLSSNTKSDDLSTTETAIQRQYSKGIDVYLVVLSGEDRNVLFSSYFGGDRNDEAYDLHCEPDGTLAITGRTSSTDLPVSQDAYKGSLIVGGPDGFILRSSEVIPPIADAGLDVTIDQHELVSFNGSGSYDNVGIEKWNWSFVYDGDVVALQGVQTNFLFHHAGTYHVILNVSDAVANWATDMITVTVRDITPPVAVAGDDMVIDQRTIVEFNGTDSYDNVGIVNWSWSFEYDGDVIKLDGQSNQFTFITVGMYVVKLNVTDAAGLWSVAIMNITVLDTTPPTTDAGTDQEVDQHAVVILNGNSSWDNMGIVNWTWEFRYDGEDVQLFGSIREFMLSTAGVYIITLTTTDAAGNQGADQLIITVRDTTPPLANAGPDIEVNQGQEVELDASRSTDNVGVKGAVWTFEYEGETRELFGTTTSFIFNEPGTYIVTVNVSDSAGNWDTDELEIRVIDITPPVANAGSDIDIDQHGTAALDGSGSMDNVAIISWTWTFKYDDQNKTLEGEAVTFIFEIPGIYNVNLLVVDAIGNNATDTVNVVVHDIEPPVAIAGEDMIVRIGEEINFDGSESKDNVGIVQMVWTFVHDGKEVRLTGERPTYEFTKTGSYNVTLKVYDDEGNSGTDTIFITVRSSGDDIDNGNFYIWLVVIAVIVLGVVGTLFYLRR